ncbi:hypothetical protein GCM10008957_51400 [Deinococcus ruber]|uniref:NodB homology domain-containing protein n=1 Tax=Deinococcus ruber TaxID=1848197 RepID=A0A918FFR9_9DEIO|nr:hypothetical protein GCM10008957_51400 [Deinococcus ruber]
MTWNVDPQDDQHLAQSASIVTQVPTQVTPGSIVLLHDGGGNRSATVDALQILIPALRARGYQFVSLDHLLTIQEEQASREQAAHQLYESAELSPRSGGI